MTSLLSLQQRYYLAEVHVGHLQLLSVLQRPCIPHLQHKQHSNEQQSILHTCTTNHTGARLIWGPDCNNNRVPSSLIPRRCFSPPTQAGNEAGCPVEQLPYALVAETLNVIELCFIWNQCVESLTKCKLQKLYLKA